MLEKLRNAFGNAQRKHARWAELREVILPQLWHWGEVELAPAERRLGRVRLGPFGLGFTRPSHADAQGEAWSLLDADSLSCEFATALEAAQENLCARGMVAWHEGRSGALISTNQDDFDAARLVCGIDQFRDIERPLVIAPDRSTLVAADAGDLDAVCEAIEIASAVYADKEATSRKLSLTPLVLSGGEWQIAMPSSLSPQLQPYDLRIRVLEFFDWYNAFQEARDGQAPEQFDDLRYGFVEDTPSAAWMEGQDYLFEADELRFYRSVTLDDFQRGRLFLGSVAWGDLMSSCGASLLSREDTWPPVYTVRRFPTARELEKLGLARDLVRCSRVTT